MKTLIAVAIAASIAFLLWRGARRGGQRDERAHELVERGGRLLDVRSPGEFRSGHLEGAINIPVDELPSRLGELAPKDQPVVVYCASGIRSRRAVQTLREAGFGELHDLKSMRYW